MKILVSSVGKLALASLMFLSGAQAQRLPVQVSTPEPDLGGASCKICDCGQWKPSSGGETCINHNSQGGTCNHTYSEHR